MNRSFAAPFVFLLSCLLVCCPGFAQDENPSKQDEKKTSQEEVEKTPAIPAEYASPRATLKTFFDAVAVEDYTLAASCLELDYLGDETSGQKLKSLCDKMYVLLHDAWKVDPEAAKAAQEEKPYPLYLATTITDSSAPSVDDAGVRIAKSEVSGKWLITAASVRLVDEELFDKWVGETGVSQSSSVKMNFPMWLESQIPPGWKKKTFLIKDYQWLALMVLLLAGLAVDYLTRMILNLLTHVFFYRVITSGEKKNRRNLWKPVGILLNALTWYFGASLIDLPAGFLSVLLVGLKFFAVFAFTWTAFSAINLLGDYWLRKARKNSSRYEHLLVPFIKNGLKILAVCIGLVFFVDVFSLNWNSLLGGFGLGGIAIAIASKDVLGNVFGSLTVLTDRPFEIGDWVITEGVEGEVEAVGFRSSRIRTFYNSLVVVPNSRLTTAIVDNMGRRKYRRVKTMVGVEYNSSPDQLEALCEGIRELIRQNPSTRKDYFHVYVNEFGASSINILVYFFLKTPDWAGELNEKHNILINIVKLSNELNVNLAFPTQTLHVLHEEAKQNTNVEFESPREHGKRVAASIDEAD